MPKPSTRHNEILAIYDKYGGLMSLRRLTQYCLEAGVWSEEEQHNFAFATMQRECQRALQHKNSLGLPVAGPTPQKSGNAYIWAQLNLWDEEISLFNMALRIKQGEKDYDTLECLWRYHEQRWGNAPRFHIGRSPTMSPCGGMTSQRIPTDHHLTMMTEEVLS